MEVLTRVVIINEEDKGQQPIALIYNPKDITIDRAVPWQPHANSEADSLEFTSGGSTTMSVELLLDTYETSSSVKDLVDQIARLTMPMRIQHTHKKRPPLCGFVWGQFGKFRGVIETMQTKYTMFFGDGTPCRATVTLKIKQASELWSQGEKKPDHRKDAEAEGRDDVRQSH